MLIMARTQQDSQRETGQRAPNLKKATENARKHAADTAGVKQPNSTATKQGSVVASGVNLPSKHDLLCALAFLESEEDKAQMQYFVDCAEEDGSLSARSTKS